jgi:DNA-binding transcriptional regulator LsrR (DeoR family)
MSSDIYSQSAFLVLKTAYMYYIDEMSQQSIADELDISVTTVSRLIKKAKKDQVVKYVVDSNCIKCMNLAEELKERFQLLDVIIAPQTLEDDGCISPVYKRKMVALEGARYLQRIIQENDVLGISWGRIVCDMLLYLNPSHKVNTTFVTLHGKLGHCIRQDLEELVRGMARAFSGKNYYLVSEALAATKQDAERIRQQKNTQKVYDMFDSINISITGVGTWYPESKSILAEYGFLSEVEQALLRENKAIGDIGLRFFDKNGMECQTELSERLISIELEQFKKIERKITVAAGQEKVYSILSAIKGGLIDVLILDEKLAIELLKIGKNYNFDYKKM